MLFPESISSGLPPELSLNIGGLNLIGTSVAARATAFALPELGLAVDVGRLTPTVAQQPVMLLTHAHLDHTAGLLAYLNLRSRFYQNQETTVWVPAPVHGELTQALRLFPGMASVAKRLPLEEAVRPLEEEQEIRVGGVTVRAFAVQHSVPTLGFRLFLPGEDRPRVVFASDGDPRFFSRHLSLLEAQVAVVECTYLGKNRRVAARLAQHAHLLDWVNLAPELPVDVLVLAHLPQELPPEPGLHELCAAFPGRVVVWAPPTGSQKPLATTAMAGQQ